MMGELIIGLMLSSHIGLGNNFNYIHPSISLKNDDYIVGVYKNSYYKTSLYTGIIKEYGDVEIYYGAVTGYIKPVIPFIALKKELVKDIKIVVIPSFDINRNNPGIILGLEITK